MKTIRTRIAPSPTGFPHIGTIYQVLIDYAYAKKHQGKFVLRIEDTDRNRLVEGAEEVIYNSLSWFGLNPDESPLLGGPFAPYRQSERLPIYAQYAEELLRKGHAYYCFCTRERLEEMRKKQEQDHKPPMYDKHCKYLSQDEIKQKLSEGIAHVIRMDIPENEKIIVNDLLSGVIEFDSNVIDHQVIIKSDGFPTYHFGVVVDDHLMEITHVFRGKEWISSTPKHVLLYKYFGWEMPVHAHLPLILNADGKGKLSKRHGHSSVDYYRNQGYLPDAVLNYLSNIIWNHPEGKEIYSLDEFIKTFELETVTSQAPRFDLQKLDWVNKEYIKALSIDELYNRLIEFDAAISQLPKERVMIILPLINERMKTLSEFWNLAGFFFKEVTEFEKSLDKEIVSKLSEVLTDTDWTHDAMEQAVRSLCETLNQKPKEVFMMLRLAITGKTVGPPLLESLELLGKPETLKRLNTKQ